MYKKMIFKSWLRFKEDYYRLQVKERTSVTQHHLLATEACGDQYKMPNENHSEKQTTKLEIKINDVTRKFAWLRDENKIEKLVFILFNYFKT